jgi:hypothetical protein
MHEHSTLLIKKKKKATTQLLHTTRQQFSSSQSVVIINIKEEPSANEHLHSHRHDITKTDEPN